MSSAKADSVCSPATTRHFVPGFRVPLCGLRSVHNGKKRLTERASAEILIRSQTMRRLLELALLVVVSVAATGHIAIAQNPVDYDSQAEQRLLVLANQSRRQVGAPPLKMDEGLSEAARIHARAMGRVGELSHQFHGEPALPERLAATTQLQLEEEGENVALDYNADDAHEHLMHSPPHRANLLNPNFNVVGMGVIHSGENIYVAQDFGRAVPHYSVAEVKVQVAAAITRALPASRRASLQPRDWLGADDAACSMAKADKLGTPPVHKLEESYSVLTYTSLHPDRLPDGAVRAITGRNLRTFSIGACYARTATYPTGVYWVVLVLD